MKVKRTNNIVIELNTTEAQNLCDCIRDGIQAPTFRYVDVVVTLKKLVDQLEKLIARDA